MEEFEDRERDIAYSRTVKAGKRIYYLDVKRNRNSDLYLSLTESKKKVSGNPENPDISYEKHKIFLYREDLSKFTEALIDVIKYIKDNESALESANDTIEDSKPIKIDLTDFE